ncbi:MAG: Jag N-terminal domain-containing protein, partial [Oscillospiraceae bacterium]
MIIDAVATGKTVDDAVLAACIKLGKAREDVEIEILELPKRGFLGLTHIPAKVRAFIEVEDASKTAERKAAEAAAAAPAPAPRQQLASMRQNPAAKDTRTPSKPAPSPAATPAPSTAPHFSKPQGQAHGKIEPASPLPTATEPLKHRESEPEDNGAMI